VVHVEEELWQVTDKLPVEDGSYPEAHPKVHTDPAILPPPHVPIFPLAGALGALAQPSSQEAVGLLHWVSEQVTERLPPEG